MVLYVGVMLTPDQFRERIEAFLETRKVTPTQFGIDCMRDPNFVRDIRNGRVPSLKVAAKVLDFIESAPTREGRAS